MRSSSQAYAEVHAFRAFFFDFFVDTASAFLAKRLLGLLFCLGLGKTKVYHERPEMSSPGSRLREGYGGPREIRKAKTIKKKKEN